MKFYAGWYFRNSRPPEFSIEGEIDQAEYAVRLQVRNACFDGCATDPTTAEIILWPDGSIEIFSPGLKGIQRGRWNLDIDRTELLSSFSAE